MDGLKLMNGQLCIEVFFGCCNDKSRIHKSQDIAFFYLPIRNQVSVKVEFVVFTEQGSDIAVFNLTNRLMFCVQQDDLISTSGRGCAFTKLPYINDCIGLPKLTATKAKVGPPAH